MAGMKSRSATGGLVYSTDAGRMCPVCRKALVQCQCTRARAAPPAPGPVRVWRETKGRGGKCVTLVKGLALEPAALLALGQKLRSACGSGGTVKDGVIEAQGDHRERITQALLSMGHAAKQV